MQVSPIFFILQRCFLKVGLLFGQLEQGSCTFFIFPFASARKSAKEEVCEEMKGVLRDVDFELRDLLPEPSAPEKLRPEGM